MALMPQVGVHRSKVTLVLLAVKTSGWLCCAMALAGRGHLCLAVRLLSLVRHLFWTGTLLAGRPVPGSEVSVLRHTQHEGCPGEVTGSSVGVPGTQPVGSHPSGVVPFPGGPQWTRQPLSDSCLVLHVTAVPSEPLSNQFLPLVP